MQSLLLSSEIEVMGKKLNDSVIDELRLIVKDLSPVVGYHANLIHIFLAFYDGSAVNKVWELHVESSGSPMKSRV